VQSVDKALDLLLLLACDGPLAASDVAGRLGLPRSSTYRFLQTLERRGFAGRDGKDGFCMGPVLISLTHGSRPQRDLRDLARPYMRRLSADFGESVFLTVEQAGDAVVIEKVSPAAPVLLQLDVGTRLPLHAGAVSKILLAFGPPIARPRRPALPAVARRTVTDPRRLERQLKEIRAKGYAVTVEEAIPGSWGVGVPILSPTTGLAIASLVIGGPIHRYDVHRTPRMVRALRRAAAAIAGAPERAARE
jgi:DNA-binding IclR family transcriptional regulator